MHDMQISDNDNIHETFWRQCDQATTNWNKTTDAEWRIGGKSNGNILYANKKWVANLAKKVYVQLTVKWAKANLHLFRRSYLIESQFNWNHDYNRNYEFILNHTEQLRHTFTAFLQWNFLQWKKVCSHLSYAILSRFCDIPWYCEIIAFYKISPLTRICSTFHLNLWSPLLFIYSEECKMQTIS